LMGENWTKQNIIDLCFTKVWIEFEMNHMNLTTPVSIGAIAILLNKCNNNYS
jgi:hypothetical protein